MIPTVRRDPFLDDDPTQSLHVFVPGLMGAGVLLSVGIMITDVLHRLRGGRGARREAGLVAWFVASDVVRSVHREQRLDATVGLRRRTTYVVNAALFLGLGVYGLIGSFWNYANPVDEGWVEDIAWLWALSLMAVAGLLALGGVLAFIGWRYTSVPSWARVFLARTPIGATPPPVRSALAGPLPGAVETTRSALVASPPGPDEALGGEQQRRADQEAG